ncbi:hypothetical protein JHK82_016085 [Glycine max]|nr:hypothetical protein JHK85_016483 [Glycine max]KAG5046706.1 hypothetical protein JHK86_016112 [Glycine max]KAG5149204.1 hypothetical protein JHK82_016085 [Glycine max]
MEKGPGVKQIDGSVVSWKPEQIALRRQGQHQKYNNFHILEKYYFKGKRLPRRTPLPSKPISPDLIPDGGGSGTCSPWQGTRSAWTGPKRTLSGPPSQS